MSLLLIVFFTIWCPMTYIAAKRKVLMENTDFMHTISYSIFFSFLAFIVTIKMIPIFMEMNHKKKIFGVDINKVQDIKDLNDPGRKEV
mgnify:CR=1 FL=1